MDLKLPHLGEGADSGIVVNLFVKVGDQVSLDQPILELENEKAVASIPSTAAGTVTTVYVKVGDKISVGQRLLGLSDSGAPAAAPSGRSATATAPKAAAQVEAIEPEPVSEPAAAAGGEPGRVVEVAASPSLRKTAREIGLDLSLIRGSGRGGRIQIEDVRAYLQRLQRPQAQPKAAAGAPAPKPAPESIDFSKWGPVTRKAFSPLRQVIARRMSESWNAVPHVTQFDDADITSVDALRKKYAAAYEQKGARLTLTVFVLKAVTDVLKLHPAFNSSLDEATQELVLKNYFHIGVAVDTEAGLIVPVLRDVDKKSLLDLAKELEEMAKKARERKVSGDDLKGGTFTISNQGGFGGAHFTPIVNRPEVAILGLGRGGLKPVVREGRIEPRLLLPMGLSYDHRVIDGGSAARFIVDLVAAFGKFSEENVRI
jgi:pyruvate dehydrogenase E2 component (dihydrolipoamide acetyltransferase)